MQYPNDRRVFEFRLTTLNPSVNAAIGARVKPRAGATTLGYPDAVVFLPDRILLWEAKDTLNGVALGQIEQYGAYWPQSYEATLYPNLPVELHLLVAHDNPALHALASSKGIQVSVYLPSWYSESQAAPQASTEAAS